MQEEKEDVKEQKKIEKEEKNKEQARKISIYEGSGYSFMDGFGLRYITPFAVAIGATNFIIGLLSSVPGLIGSFVQLFSLKQLGKTSRRKIVFISVLLQALMWLPMIGIGLAYFIYGISPFSASVSLLLTYSIFVIVGSVSGPAWSSWMRDIIPKEAGDYFGKRSVIIGFLAMLAMMIAGFILDYFTNAGKIVVGFSILFSVAFLGRIVSALLFLKQYEPEYKEDKTMYFSFVDFVKKMMFNNYGRFVFFVSLMGFATAIGSPFFAVYMLKDLGFENTYTYYTYVAMASVISSLATTRPWGRFIDKYGNIVVLKITAFGIAILPFLWIVSYFVYSAFGFSQIHVMSFLLVSELFSGIVWAGFGLSSGVFVYQAVTKQRLPLCATYHGIVASILGFLGAL